MKNEGSQPKSKYLILIFGALAIFFTGYPHIWSIYQPYAMDMTGWSQSQASMCFYLYFVTFVLGNITGGRIQDKYNPKIAVIIGGGIFTASILLSTLALLPSPFVMYLTYGILQGFGQGMIYTTIISTAQKWFPGRTGFASGVIVTANGLFGFFMAPVSRSLLGSYGIKTAFLVFGALICISWILSSIFIKNPVIGQAGKQQKPMYVGKQYTSKEMIRTKRFYFLLATMLFGLIPYLILSPLSQTVQMDRGITSAIAVGAVMAGSIFNAATRLVLPAAADKVGRIVCLKGVLLVAAAAMLLLVAAPAALTPVSVVLMYACYGGVMGSFPSLCSSIFGMEHSGENYGFVMFGIAVATLSAPVITNLVLGNGWSMNVVFAVGAMSAAIAFGFLLLLEWELNKRSEKVIGKMRGEEYHGISKDERIIAAGGSEK